MQAVPEDTTEASSRPLDRRRRSPDARVALDLRDATDGALQERLLEDDPREAEHQRRLEEERQAHVQAMELLRLKNSLQLKRQNTPMELIRAKAQAFLAIGMGILALGTLCYLLVRSDTPMELKKDILKYVGGAIGGVGVGYALGKQATRDTED
jgi:hypothetical protein